MIKIKETKRSKTKSVRKIKDISGVGKPQGRRTIFQRRGCLMNIKRADSNLLILVSPGGSSTVCARENFFENSSP